MSKSNIIVDDMKKYQVSSKNVSAEMEQIIHLKETVQNLSTQVHQLRSQVSAHHPDCGSIGNVNAVFNIEEQDLEAGEISHCFKWKLHFPLK